MRGAGCRGAVIGRPWPGRFPQEVPKQPCQRLALSASLLLAAATLAAPARAQLQITEWMYTGNGPEFVEFTNLGRSAVDLAGWSDDDDSRLPNQFSLGALGVVAPGQSVVITEGDAAAFRAAWNLPASVKVLGGYSNNLGRADEINLFDTNGVLVDRLSYGDQVFAGSIRTQTHSGTPVSLAALQPFTVHAGWVLSVSGDAYGSWMSSQGDVGDPGLFTLAAPVPEPASLALFAAGAALLGSLARRRQGGAR